LGARAKQRLKLTGAAILVFPCSNVFGGGPRELQHGEDVQARLKAISDSANPFFLQQYGIAYDIPGAQW
jgi:hypothetical protein